MGLDFKIDLGGYQPTRDDISLRNHIVSRQHAAYMYFIDGRRFTHREDIPDIEIYLESKFDRYAREYSVKTIRWFMSTAEYRKAGRSSRQDIIDIANRYVKEGLSRWMENYQEMKILDPSKKTVKYNITVARPSKTPNLASDKPFGFINLTKCTYHPKK